jgi:1,4-alpha-glucan branching enzyme
MKKSHSRPVEFSCDAPQAKAVFVAGTFNDWKPDAAPLRADLPNGKWAVTLPLPQGRHEFKFVVDGAWCCEPGCEHEYRGCPKCVPNEFGTMNRVLAVS